MKIKVKESKACEGTKDIGWQGKLHRAFITLQQMKHQPLGPGMAKFEKDLEKFAAQGQEPPKDPDAFMKWFRRFNTGRSPLQSLFVKTVEDVDAAYAEIEDRWNDKLITWDSLLKALRAHMVKGDAGSEEALDYIEELHSLLQAKGISAEEVPGAWWMDPDNA